MFDVGVAAVLTCALPISRLRIWEGSWSQRAADIFLVFLWCQPKAHLKLAGAWGDQQEFPEWERTLVEDYTQQCYRQWRADCGEAECLAGVGLPHDLDNSRCRLVMDCTVRTQEMQTHLHAVERVAAPGKTNHSPHVPIRCVPRENIARQAKL